MTNIITVGPVLAGERSEMLLKRGTTQNDLNDQKYLSWLSNLVPRAPPVASWKYGMDSRLDCWLN